MSNPQPTPEIKDLCDLYAQTTGCLPEHTEPLPTSGSNRHYFRLSSQNTIPLIGVIGNSLPENEAFLYLADHFHKRGLPVPKVHAVSSDHKIYLQQDLGQTSLFDAIVKGRQTRVFGTDERRILSETIRRLPEIQFAGSVGLDYAHCWPVQEFDRRTVMWDLNYFKYCFLKATGAEFDESRLEDDFQALAEVLLRSHASTFMYRDFQSRNVMMDPEGHPWFIDFQGGRKGPFYYDVASFLWQAKANFPDSLRKHLIDQYVEALRRYKPVDRQYFDEQLRHFVLFRTLQVLGAYGFRGYFEKKPHFVQSVPFAIANLRELLATQPFSEYPYLNSLLNKLVDMHQFADDARRRQLTVRVLSFAYKKGIPSDPSGNGGGYVFDCRALNNPGKYDRYKPFTGMDQPVIKFLEDDGGVFPFLQNAQTMVDSSVSRYIERGFTSLMVAFGCTGGQHRSVYCAQQMAQHIHDNFNVTVELIHREQDASQTLLPQ